MFSIVEFDDGLQLVPNSWLEVETFVCYWPPNIRSQAKLNKMISSQAEPQPSWGEMEYRRTIGEATDSYVKGIAKLKLYRVISDLDSKPSDGGKTQRKDLKRKNASESESDVESRPSTSTKRSSPRVSPKKASKQDSESDQGPAVDDGVQPVAGCSASSSHDESIPEIIIPKREPLLTDSDTAHISAVEIESRTQKCSCRCYDNNLDHFSAAERESQTQARSCNCNQSFMNFLLHILRKTNNILHRVQMLEDKLNLMVPLPGSDSESLAIMERFPLKDLNELDTLESFLSGENNYKVLVRSLQGIGGSSVYYIVANIMNRAFTNRLGEMFSWAGAKKKRAFKDLLFSRAILDTARFRYPNVTEYETALLIANWLRHAKQRRERAEGAASKKNISLII